MELQELEPVFAALRDDKEETLVQALSRTVSIAKARGMDASEFGRTLEDVGIEFTPAFRRWLEAQFIKNEW